MKEKELAAEIYEEFQSLCPPAECWQYAGIYSDVVTEKIEIYRLINTRKWIDIESDFYRDECSSSLFIDDDIYRYYLPGFLIDVLINNTDSGLRCLLAKTLKYHGCFRYSFRIDITIYSDSQIKSLRQAFIFILLEQFGEIPLIDDGWEEASTTINTDI